MNHPLKLTNGTACLIHSIMHIPDTFKTPSDVMRAAELVALIAAPEKVEDKPGWVDENSREISVPEKSRDLLKEAMKMHASKLPPSRFTFSILQQLGFEQ